MSAIAFGFTQSCLRKTSQLTSERVMENANENENENPNENPNKNQNQNGNEDADKISNEKMDGAVSMREPSSFTLQRDQIKTEQVWPIIPEHGSNNNNEN